VGALRVRQGHHYETKTSEIETKDNDGELIFATC
jgi:hypothetical protein